MISLTPLEIRLAKAVAHLRMTAGRAQARADLRIGPQDEIVTDTEGASAELALCRMLNIYPAGVLQTARPDNGADLTINGWSIDVKASKYQTARLLVATHKRKHADLYVLLIGENGRYNFGGWATREELLRRENLQDLGHGLTYALAQDKLKNAAELWRFVRSPR